MSKSTLEIFEPNLTPRDLISKAKIRVHKRTPFFAYLIEHLQYIATKKTPTMGVDGKAHCFYNEKFVEEVNTAELEGVLAHEILHLALRHPERGKGREIIINGDSLWNIAIDISVNHMLVENNFTLPCCGIIPKDGSITVYGITVNNIPNKSSEEIYEELKAQIKKLMQKQQSQGNGIKEEKNDNGNVMTVSGFDEDEGKGFDEHGWKGEPIDKTPDDFDSKSDGASVGEIKEPTNKNWEKILAEAYNHAKMIGKSPAGFEREFSDLHKSKLNWRSILRRTVSSSIPYDMTYRRPNKKYLWGDIYQPSFTGEKITVMCAIDTSGSMSAEDLSNIISELLGLARSFSQVDFRVLTHDVDVHDDIPVNYNQEQKLKQIKLHGGGGTSHEPLYEYISTKRYERETKLLLSFTDGYSSFPDRRPSVDTTFILTGGHCPVEDMPGWGSTICLK